MHILQVSGFLKGLSLDAVSCVIVSHCAGEGCNIESAHYDDSVEIAPRGVILHCVVIIVHILVASTLQLDDTVRQFKVLPRTNDCQPPQPNNTYGL